MKPARTGILLLTLLVLMTLGGCINLKQEMWLNPDGTGKISVDMGVSKPFMEIARNGGAEAGRDPFQAIKDQYEGSPNPLVKNLTSRLYTENDMEHYAVSLDVTDLGKYIEQQAAVSQGGVAQITLIRLENGNLAFTQVLDPGDPEALRAGLDPGQLETLFKDQDWVVILHASGVVRADPEGSRPDGGTVEWRIPIATVVGSQAPIKLFAELNTNPGAGATGETFPLAVPLAAAAMVGLFFILRRRPMESGEDPHPYAPYPPASMPDRDGGVK